jgi:hypothetical protein
MANPYAYEVIPPIGRLLSAISDHCSVGGTIRPRNRTLAEWANYASAGHIAPLLDQLACDGWILYDRTTGLITLLYDPAAEDAPQYDPRLAPKQERRKVPGHIYVIKCGDAYKIGCATNVEARIEGLSLPSYELIHTIASEDMYRDESALHTHFRLKRLRREWFTLESDDLVWLVEYHSDPAMGSIPPLDQNAESALIPSLDRRFAHQNAAGDFDPAMDQTAQCMEDHVLVAAALDSESAAARSKIPCAADSIPPMDHRASLLSELGTAPKLIAKALTKRPDLTPGQIRATWSHFEPRIKAGLCSAGAFHAAIANGQIHAAPPDPTAPLDPASYAGRADIMLGSDLPPPDAPESIGDIARRLLPPDASTSDWVFVQSRLVRHDSEAGALAALAARRAVRR